jgi:Zn finger protein HypA/HybF involved in hydrogenase expression
MPGTEYECKDCSRAFLVYVVEDKEPKCPSCESGNVAPKQAQPLPSWILSKNIAGSS